jgi:hypothetical protein
MAALACSKKINDCPKALLKFIVYAGQSFICFAPLSIFSREQRLLNIAITGTKKSLLKNT